LVISRVENRFPQEYVPTVFDNYDTTTQFDNEDIHHSFWDTAGEEEYDRLRPLSYPDTDLFVITTSVVSPTSFENIRTKWVPEVNNNGFSHVGKLIVGTKQDLREDEETLQKLKEELRSYDEGVALANEVGAIGYLECSAKTQEGVSQLFDEIFRYFLSIKHTGSREYQIPMQRNKAKSARK